MTHLDNIQVMKRDGHLEDMNLNKIHKVIAWAAEGLENVSVSQVEVKFHIQFYDQIKTRDIHETIIKSAADLMSEETPDYQYLAARLAIFHLQKIAYSQFEPLHLYKRVKKLTADGNYDKHILEDYSVKEFNDLEKYIDHWRDMNLTCASVEQMAGKYQVRDRVNRPGIVGDSTFWENTTMKRQAYIPEILGGSVWDITPLEPHNQVY